MTHHEAARLILAQEVADRPIDLSLAAQAVTAAEELLPFPRETWAQPRDRWEHTVIAAALAVIRLRGGRKIGHAEAVAAVRDALAVLACEAA